MATTFTGLRVQDTYNAILKIGDNSNLSGTAKILSDGVGNSSSIYLSTTRFGIGITPAYQFHTSGNAKIGGNLIISGNLTVNGTLTYLNVQDLAVEDPIIKLAKDNTANTLDIGLFGKYVATGTKYKGFFNDASDDKFKLFIGTTVEPTTTVDTSASGYTMGTLVANIEGNVIGNLSGNVTGNLTGNVTGGTISGTNGSFSSNVLISGYVDITDFLYTRNTLRVLNAAGNGWHNWAVRNNGKYDLDVNNITGGTISATTGTFSSDVILSGTNKILKLNSGGFIDFDGNSLQFNTQRNPNTGDFFDDNKSHAHIGLQGANGGSQIIFQTSNANDTVATTNLTITPSASTFTNSLIGTTATFTGLVTGIAPTSDLNLATKKYVDDNISDAYVNTIAYKGGEGTKLDNSDFNNSGIGTNFKWIEANSGSTGSTWKKVADVVLNSTGFKNGVQMEVKVLQPNTDWGDNASLNTIYYSISFRGDESDTGPFYDNALVYGQDADLIRVYKTSTHNYELQARSNDDNRDLVVECNITSKNSAKVTFTTDYTDGTITGGTAYTASSNSLNKTKFAGNVEFEGAIFDDAEVDDLRVNGYLYLGAGADATYGGYLTNTGATAEGIMVVVDDVDAFTINSVTGNAGEQNTFFKVDDAVKLYDANGVVLETVFGGVDITGTLDVTGDLFIGASGTTPKVDMLFTTNSIGAKWDTRVFIGKSDDLPGGAGEYPTYEPSGSYGIQFQSNSDGAFFGIEDYGNNQFRPVINWGDDNTDTPFRFKFNGSPIVTIDYTGNITAPEIITTSTNPSKFTSGGIRSKYFAIYDGTTTQVGGLYMEKTITGSGTSTSTVLFTEGGKNIQFATNGSTTPKMIIGTDGKVAINEDNPLARFTVNQNSLVDTEGIMVQSGGDAGNGGVAIFKSANLVGSISALGSNSNLSFMTNSGSTRMFIDNDGKIGMGLTNPSNLLHIRGTGDAIRVESTNTGAGGAQIDLLHFTTSPADNDTFGLINMGGYYSGTSSAYGTSIKSIWTDVSARNSDLTFSTSEGTLSEKFIIKSSGNVGINETLPFAKLHIKGSDTAVTTPSAQGNLLVLEDSENGLSILSSTAGAGYINFGDSDDNDIGMIIYGHSSNSMDFWTNANKRMTIDSSGYVNINQKQNSSLAYDLLINIGTSPNGKIGYQTQNQLAANLAVNSNSNWVKTGNNIYNTNSANIGIGTTIIPSDHILQISNDGQSYARFALTNSQTGNASGDGLIFQMENLNSIIKNQENGYLVFGTNGRETDLKIDSSGNTTCGGSVIANTGSKITSSSADTTFSIETTSGTTIFPILDFVSSHSTAGARIRVSGTDVISLDKSQNVGIGQSPYSYSRLSTEGSDNTSSNFAFIAYNNNTDAILACRNDLNIGMHSTGSLRFNGITDNTHATGYDSVIDGSFLRGQNGVRFLTGTGGGSERVRISSNGNTGFGTNNPQRQIHVENASDHAIISAVSGTTRISGLVLGDTSDDDRGGILYNNSSDYLYFQANGSERMRISSTGKININTTSGLAKLVVNQDSFADTEGIWVQSGNDPGNGGVAIFKSANKVGSISALGGDSNLSFMTSSSTTRMYINSVGNIGINDITPSYKLDVNGDIRATSDVIAFSDSRVKENVFTIDNALEKITKLRGVTYTRKDKTDKSTKIGVIAQEILEVLPEVVSKDDEGMYSVAYGNLAGVFIEAIKELENKIKELENKSCNFNCNCNCNCNCKCK